jgi:hypothetical protein
MNERWMVLLRSGWAAEASCHIYAGPFLTDKISQGLIKYDETLFAVSSATLGNTRQEPLYDNAPDPPSPIYRSAYKKGGILAENQNKYRLRTFCCVCKKRKIVSSLPTCSRVKKGKRNCATWGSQSSLYGTKSLALQADLREISRLVTTLWHEKGTIL